MIKYMIIHCVTDEVIADKELGQQPINKLGHEQ